MTDKTPDNPFDELTKQVQDVLGKANIHFMTDMGDDEAIKGPGGTEPSVPDEEQMHGR